MSIPKDAEHSLAELKKLTGLDLKLADEDKYDDDTSEKLKMLIGAYKDRYDKSSFVRNLLSGKITEPNIYTEASRFHIQDTGRWIVYVIECKNGIVDTVTKVMKHLFVSSSADQFVVLDGHRFALIRTMKKKSDDGDALALAHMIVDMLNTEAMIQARVGYGSLVTELKGLAKSYREARISLEVGSTFYSTENVLGYSRLGIGRLIYQLPDETCRMFLGEVFGDFNPDDLDDETVAIIDSYFENNLNISETARALYVHRNTLVYRLDKLRQLTGLDLRVFDDAVELKIGMMVSSCLKARAVSMQKKKE